MKYNGEKVTEEIAELIHQKVNEEFVPGDHDYIYNSDILRVLQAAEEVFAETQPKTELNSELERIIANLDAAQQEYNPHIDRVIEDLTKLKEAQHGEG